MTRVVLDTSVLVAGLRSRRGASHRLLKLLGQGKFEVCISVPLVLEYESASKRISRSLGLRQADIDDILDYVCSVAEHRKVHFLWRPFLRDPGDDMVLELAVESESDYIVTHNISDFAGIRRLGVEALTPGEFLRKIGEL
ncbi:MAG: putative toxin-antitoxin system toxin component, PIN family [Candidatus Krumholzibacteria bacterium]|nr:putative toxin-antitoxin system toxin component, PIN family [Candidatus Krumholzibacteria bacterium]MDH4337565.1 putative toxin-antitoxin system toxin component, PIN family [Candidatus Krumholzibacteria bacterium]MDH5269908.1 putative toxin-antitoxin system toxin component, PIN family [Candidatus Krumholzibacteria bacterium]